MIATGSFLAPFLLGVAFNNLAEGLPIDANMTFTGNFLTLINPYGVIGGLTMVSVFLLHGANFLTLRLEGELRDRARQAARKVYWAAAGTVVLLAVIIHKMPDSMSISSILLSSGWDRNNVGKLNLLFSLTTPIGAVLAFLAAGNQHAEYDHAALSRPAVRHTLR